MTFYGFLVGCIRHILVKTPVPDRVFEMGKFNYYALYMPIPVSSMIHTQFLILRSQPSTMLREGEREGRNIW